MFLHTEGEVCSYSDLRMHFMSLNNFFKVAKLIMGFFFLAVINVVLFKSSSEAMMFHAQFHSSATLYGQVIKMQIIVHYNGLKLLCCYFPPNETERNFSDISFEGAKELLHRCIILFWIILDIHIKY